jgi:peptidoglycan DL-endopeptidase LytF
MTRKDIIIIAVLANIGVLAILFMLAFRGEESKIEEQPEISYTLVETSSEPQEESENSLAKIEPLDEGDALLNDLAQNPLAGQFATEDDDGIPGEDTLNSRDVLEEQPQNDRFVEVTIKRGDALEKIARANGTTVETIKNANQLKTDRLKIGQVLQVPVGTVKKPAETTKQIASNTNSSSEAHYYTIKSGDNPWKIAKQFQIRVDDLLKLNDLNEERARNLKIGDQIRVK